MAKPEITAGSMGVIALHRVVGAKTTFGLKGKDINKGDKVTGKDKSSGAYAGGEYSGEIITDPKKNRYVAEIKCDKVTNPDIDEIEITVNNGGGSDTKLADAVESP